MQAMSLSKGQKVSGTLSKEEIQEATEMFRADGWKTIISFTNYAGTNVTHTSVKEGEDIALEHTINLQGYPCPGTEEEVLYAVTLRFVDRKEVDQYIRDWEKHCKPYSPKKGLQRGEDFLTDMVLDITDQMKEKEEWEARLGIPSKAKAKCDWDRHSQIRKELDEMFNR